MTAERDLDRTTRAWLDLMPGEAPDRVIDAVLQAVDATPQVRAPWLAGPTRSFTVNRFLLTAATAAVVVGLLGGAALLAGGRPSPNPTAPPSTQPAAAASATPSPAAPSPEAWLAALDDRWTGAPRNVPGIGSSGHTTLTFDGSLVHLEGGDYEGAQLISRATLVAPDRLRLTLVQDSPGLCAAGVVGTYAWTVSPGRSRLHWSSVDDACGARQVAFSGDWYRVAGTSACPMCFGKLEAGSYPTVNFGPRLDPDQLPTAVFDQMTYTVPAGWAITSDHTSDVQLVHTDEASATAPAADIEVWIRPAANLQTDPCTRGPDRSVATNARALADWMASLPAIDSTAPTAITIDGNRGWWIDIKLAPTWTASCDGFSPAVPLIAENVGKAGSVGDDPYGVGVAGDDAARFVFLDLGGGRTVMVVAHVTAAGSLQGFVREAMPIIESLKFPRS